MKTFFQLREQTSGKTIRVSRDIYEAAERMMNESLKPFDTPYDPDIEDKVSDKHGLNAAHYASSKGHHAVAVEPDHRGGKMGSSSLGDHDTHSHHIILHPGNKETHVKLPSGKKATAAHVAKQAPKAPASIHKVVADEHNMGV